MTEWEMVRLLKGYQRMIERNGDEYPSVALNDISASIKCVLGKLPKKRNDVVEVKNDKDLIIRFADGIEFSVLEGVVPSHLEKNHEDVTSDMAFVMDTTETADFHWEFVGYAMGITMMDIDDVVKLCKDLREEHGYDG